MDREEHPSADAQAAAPASVAAVQLGDSSALTLAVDAARRSRRLTPAHLLGLQRTAGNRATKRLLAREAAQRIPGPSGELTSEAEAVRFAGSLAPRAGTASLTTEYYTLFRFLVKTYLPAFWQRLGRDWTFDSYPYQTFTFRIMQTPKAELIGIGPAVFRRIAAGQLRNVVTELEGALKRLLPTPIGFQEAMLEGAQILHPKFGLAGGNAAGPDPGDGYDASEWDELPTPRGVLQCKLNIEPWVAMKHLVDNVIDDVSVPKAGGGMTKWSTDCFEYVVLLRIYAFWRSMTRAEFNKRFARFQLGFFAKTNLVWKPTIVATKPGEAPFRWGEETSKQGSTELKFDQKKIPVGKTWRQLLADAPIGTQVIWSNKDATAQCSKDANLSFCAYMNENTTKVGDGKYAAHPFGVVDEHTIVTEMAKAVVGDPIPRGYIQRNIFISAMRQPGD
jgi:hypothetical protein